jgi:hypothetical protein
MQTMQQVVRVNFEQKVAYVAQALPTMRVTQDKGFLAVDCGLPSDTYNVIVGFIPVGEVLVFDTRPLV